MNECEYATTCATSGNVAKTTRRSLTKVCRERSHYQEMIFLCNSTSLGIVLSDRGVFITEIHLNDFFHVLIQLSQFFFELRRLGPDAAIDVTLFIVRQVHQRSKILPLYTLPDQKW